MKKILRRIGGTILILLLCLLSANASLWYGARSGYGMGYVDGMKAMYIQLVKPA